MADNDLDLIKQAYERLSPSPGAEPSPDPTQAPRPSADPGVSDVDLINQAYSAMRGPRPAALNSAVISPSPMATPSLTPLPTPAPTMTPEMTPPGLPSPTPAPMNSATNAAMADQSASLGDNIGAFSRGMNRLVDPRSLFSSEAWTPGDLRGLGLISGVTTGGIGSTLDIPAPKTAPVPGLYEPFYQPEPWQAGVSDIPQIAGLAPHKAAGWEAAGLNLLQSFASSASSAKGLVSFLPPVFMAETARSLPELWSSVREAEKTPAGSQQRWEASMAMAATLTTMGFMGRPALNMLRNSRAAMVNSGMLAPARLVNVPPPGQGPPVVVQPGEGGFRIFPGGRFRPVPETPRQSSVGEPVEQKTEEPLPDVEQIKEKQDAEQPSVQKVEGGETPQQQQERAPSPVPAGPGAGDSDLSERAAEGTPTGRQVPPVKPSEERHPEALSPEDLTDKELDDALENAVTAYDQNRGEYSDVIRLLREKSKRKLEKAKPKPTPSRPVPPTGPPREPTKEEVKIANLTKSAKDIQNQLSFYKEKPLDEKGVKLQEDLREIFNKIHALREQTGQPRDFVIIGGGAAGLKAAGQAAYEGMDVVVLEKSPTVGGQAKRSMEIVNTGAEEFGVRGRNYFRPRELTAINRGADIRTGVEAVDLKPRPDGGVDVITKGGGVIPARRVAIMSGASISPFDAYKGFENAGWGNAERLARNTEGKVGLVYGAGNSATQAVIGAIDRGAKKIILMSRHEFGPEASDDQVARIRQMARGKNAKVEIVTASIKSAEKDPSGEGFLVKASNGKTYHVAHLENFLTTNFNTAWIPSSIERAPGPPPKPGRPAKPGQIHVTDASGKTSMPGVYVGGDIRESLPGEDRPRRIDMAEGDATGIAARVVDDIGYARKSGELPEWRPETAEETQAIDTRLKALKDPGTVGTKWEDEHGDVTPNRAMPPMPLVEPVAPFREPQPQAKVEFRRPGYEGPESKLSPEMQRKIIEASHVAGQKAAEQAVSGAATATQQEQQSRTAIVPLVTPRQQGRLRETPPLEERQVQSQANARMESNPNYPNVVLTEMAGAEKNYLTPVESRAVLDERSATQTKLDAAGKRAMDKSLHPGDRSEAMHDYNDLDNRIRLMDDITDGGNLLSEGDARAWHVFRAKDYNQTSMETKLEIAQQGKPLTVAQKDMLGVQVDRLEKGMAKEAAYKSTIGFRFGKPMTADQRQALRDIQWEEHQAKTKLDDAILDARFRQRSLLYRALMRTGQSFDFSRAVMTSTDLSAVLRQGGLIVHSHPIMAMKEIPDMLRAAKSDRAYFDLMQDIRERPNAHYYVTSQLGLTDIKTPKWSQMEEMYGSDWADRIPIIGHSQRAYVYFLNRMRADMFDKMAATLPRSGLPSPDQASAISNFINTFTGRGRTPAALGASMRLLNQFFFAPRWTVSRFEALTGDPFWAAGNAPGVRKMIAQEYARTLLGYATEYSLAYFALKPLGVEIETDPRSAQWMSIKIGDTRWNPLAGLTQPMVLMSRLGATGLESTGVPIVGYKDAAGNLKSLRSGKYGQPTVGSVFMDFLRGRAAPLPGAIWNGLEGKNVVGQPTTWGNELWNLVHPITFGDVSNAIRSFGAPLGLALAILAIFGDNVNTYATKANMQGVRQKKPHPKGRVRKTSP